MLRRTRVLHIVFLPSGIQIRTIVNTLGQVTNVAFSPNNVYESTLNCFLKPNFYPLPIILKREFIINAKIYRQICPP